MAQRRKATSSSQYAGVARAACRHADVLSGSNLARGSGQNQPGADATARSPDAALPSQRHSIDEAFAAGRNDNCECWHHTPRADCHRLLGGVHAEAISGQRDTATFHQAGERSLGPRNAQLSRAGPPEGEHSPKEAPRVVKDEEELAQIRSCATSQVEADAPTPGAGSSSQSPGLPPIGSRYTMPLVPRPNDCTNDPGPVRCLHLRGSGHSPRDAGTTRPHRRS
jgi:hypothetical protein